jgi:hypothetical protein
VHDPVEPFEGGGIDLAPIDVPTGRPRRIAGAHDAQHLVAVGLE